MDNCSIINPSLTSLWSVPIDYRLIQMDSYANASVAAGAARASSFMLGPYLELVCLGLRICSLPRYLGLRLLSFCAEHGTTCLDLHNT